MPDFFIKVPILNPLAWFHAQDDAADIIRKVSKNGIMKISTFGRTSIIVSDAELIKEVTIKNAKDYPKPLTSYKLIDIYGPNIVSTNDDVWRNHRAIADPAFAEKHMYYLVEETAKSTHLMFGKWKQQTMNKSLIIDPDRDMTDITLDIIGKTNFGYDLGIFTERTFDPKTHKMTFFDALSLTTTLGLLVRGKVPPLIQPLFKQTLLAVEETEKYMQELIDDRVKNLNVVRYDLFSLLVESNLKQEESADLSAIQRRLTDKELISDVYIFLLAGHETSTTTLQWILYELVLNPDKQQKAYETVMQVLGTRDPTYEDYDKLDYIKCIMNESLRLHPPVSMVPKVTRKNVTLGGYNIPKGTPIDIAIHAVQTSEEYWDEPYKWIPERFQESDLKRNSCAFIPFSVGARRCIGNTFSQIETVIIVAMILRKYQVHFDMNDETMKEIMRTKKTKYHQLVTKKPYYLRLKLVERD
jgi:cytochrome P450 family 3 subfamily A